MVPCLQVMRGYLNRPEETALTIRDGFVHTGDIGYVDEAGNLFITGRLKELIKVKGMQVAPAELEGVLLEHPEVSDACVVGIPHERAGEMPKAFVVRAPGSTLTEESVKAMLGGRLAPYKVPEEVVFIDAIPKSASGKMLRRLLVEDSAAVARPPVAASPARAATVQSSGSRAFAGALQNRSRGLSTAAASPPHDDDDEGTINEARQETSQTPSLLDIGARRIFNAEHDAFRRTCRQFFAEEVSPYHAEWEEAGMVPRELWTKAGAIGLLGVNAPEEYGGLGADKLYASITHEEQCYAKGSPTGPGFALHSDIVMPYLIHYGTEAQKQRYLPSMCAGELFGAIAMTEPGAGSDLQGIRTSAFREPDGRWRLNGSKTYITNGYLSDVVIVVARTDLEKKAAHGTSLFLVDAAKMSKGKPLKKLGFKAQDTCELFFDDALLDSDALLGELNHGFYYLMEQLPQERLQIAVEAQARAEASFEEARGYVGERKAFGTTLFEGQQTIRHKLAEMKTSLCVNRAFVDSCLELHNRGELDPTTASMAKLASTELAWNVIDSAVQLHGGAGYMWEYAVARNLADSRVPRIYGGSNEIMKELIARTCKPLDAA